MSLVVKITSTENAEAWKEAVQGLNERLQTILNSIPELLKTIQEETGDQWGQKLVEYGDVLTTSFGKLLDAVLLLVEAIGDVIREAVNFIADAIESVADAIFTVHNG